MSGVMNLGGLLLRNQRRTNRLVIYCCKINEEITSNIETLSIFNSKELNVMDSIFNYHNINFPLLDFIQSSTTFNNFNFLPSKKCPIN